MKVCVIQPKYSFDEKDLKICQNGLFELMDRCDDSLDLIVLPEYSDALADVQGKDGFYSVQASFGDTVINKAKEMARRCNAMVFVNAGYKTDNGIEIPLTRLTGAEILSADISRRIPHQAR